MKWRCKATDNVEALRSLATSAWRNGDPDAASGPAKDPVDRPGRPLKRDNFACVA